MNNKSDDFKKGYAARNSELHEILFGKEPNQEDLAEIALRAYAKGYEDGRTETEELYYLKRINYEAE